MKKVSNNPLISIIVPIYNVEKYINKCIDSILNQTYKNIEIILVDDGSTDNCPSICDKYKKMDKRIKVIHKKNGGLSDARNVGIKQSKGNYISFIDSDDFINKDFITILYNNLIKSDCDISCCELLEFKDENKINIKNNNNIMIYDKDEYIKKYMKINNQTIEYYATTKLFKKELLNNDQFPINLTSEDVLGVYKAILKSKKIVKTSLMLYYYRKNNNSITGHFSNKDFDLLSIWDKVVKLSLNNKYYDYAIYNRIRINYTLLMRMALNLNYKSIINNYYDYYNQIYNDFKSNYNRLINSNISILRKITIYLINNNYKLFVNILSIYRVIKSR